MRITTLKTFIIKFRVIRQTPANSSVMLLTSPGRVLATKPLRCYVKAENATDAIAILERRKGMSATSKSGNRLVINLVKPTRAIGDRVNVLEQKEEYEQVDDESTNLQN